MLRSIPEAIDRSRDSEPLLKDRQLHPNLLPVLQEFCPFAPSSAPKGSPAPTRPGPDIRTVSGQRFDPDTSRQTEYSYYRPRSGHTKRHVPSPPHPSRLAHLPCVVPTWENRLRGPRVRFHACRSV